MLHGLDVFSGIGGLSVALRPWVRPIAYCENDRYAQGVLLSRMRDGGLPVAPIWDDVSTLSAEHLLLAPRVDIVYGGFPCQDISAAGAGAGLGGKRSGLFFELARLIGELRPTFAFLENVPTLSVRGLDRVLLELDALGYDARWTVVSAAEVGAPHLRERIWILAHARSELQRVEQQRDARRGGGVQDQGEAVPAHDGEAQPLADPDRVEGRLPEEERQDLHEAERGREDVADAARERRVEGPDTVRAREPEPRDGGQDVAHDDREPGGQGACEREDRRQAERDPFRPGWWAVEPAVGRVADGVPFRVDRLRCLGNSVVPQAARAAFMRLMGIEGWR